MKISELFASIQGEGILTGVPSLFIRTSGCNLRCSWCDTPYTSWQPEGDQMTVDEILAWTARHPSYRHAVLTGGEPMIQPELPDLARALAANGFHITIETAGTLAAGIECHLMSISPKLANSTPPEDTAGPWTLRHEQLRINPSALASLTSNYNHQLKFVVSSESDLVEIRSIAAPLCTPPDRVLLMPEGRSREELARKAVWVAELCKQTGYRFCPRLHIDLYGSRRGV